jgi:hypothetical protein
MKELYKPIPTFKPGQHMTEKNRPNDEWNRNTQTQEQLGSYMITITCFLSEIYDMWRLRQFTLRIY